MEWLVIIVTVVVLWVASFVKLLHASLSASRVAVLTDGNADGMDYVRKELYLASVMLKVPQKQVKILDHPDLQVITFDNYGVSGHCNHCDVHQGVPELLQDTSHREVEAWELVSTNILRNYSGPVDIWLSILSAKFHLRGVVHCLLNEHPRRSIAAMAQHKSQWVWFRKLFVCYSSYTYVNCLKKIN